MKQLERILFAQGGRCFFCKQQLAKEKASVEHLVALANGGRNDEDNCVVCCKQLNSLLGSKSIKGKLLVVLNQHGSFICPADLDHLANDQPGVIDDAGPAAGTPKSRSKAKKAPHFVFTLADAKPPPNPAASKTKSTATGGSPADKGLPGAKPPDANFKLVVANLKQRGTSRPRTLKTLTSTVTALFPNGIAKREVDSLLKQLQTTGKVVLTNDKVTYAL